MYKFSNSKYFIINTQEYVYLYEPLNVNINNKIQVFALGLDYWQQLKDYTTYQYNTFNIDRNIFIKKSDNNITIYMI